MPRPDALEQVPASVAERLAWGADHQAVLDEAVQRLAALGEGWRVAALGLDERGVLRVVAGANLSPECEALVGGQPPSPATPHGAAVSKGEPVMVADALDGSWPALAGVARTGVRGLWAWPLASPEGQVLGAVSVQVPRSGGPTAEDQARLAPHLRPMAMALASWRRASALEDLRGRAQLVMEATHHAIYEHQLATGLVQWNERMAELFGYAPTAERDRFAFWAAKLHPDDRDRVRKSFAEAVAGAGTQWAAEYRFERHDGRFSFVQDRAVVQRDGAGRATRVVGVLQDVTTHHELQGRLAMTERFAAVGTLAAGVAHEINNPLAWITANVNYALEELRRPPGTPPNFAEVIAALDDVRTGADRVAAIVRNLKTFARPEEEQLGTVDLLRALEAALALSENELKHRGRVVRQLEPLPPVEGNESRISQVFLNLLLNAGEALQGRPRAESEVRVVARTDDRGRAVVEVSDTGPGIPEEVLPRIFDPFFTTKPVGKGTGLGLSVCHSIITNMGGAVEVESRPGAGATFRVLLPPAPAARELGRRSPMPVGPGQRGRIVVVDDEASVLSVFTRVLGPTHEVTTFTSAGEALEQLPRLEPHLIFCDVMMPEVSGAELYQRLQALAPRLVSRVVFMTGGAFTEETRAFLDRVRPPVLEKPFSTETLRLVVRGQGP